MVLDMSYSLLKSKKQKNKYLGHLKNKVLKYNKNSIAYPNFNHFNLLKNSNFITNLEGSSYSELKIFNNLNNKLDNLKKKKNKKYYWKKKSKKWLW